MDEALVRRLEDLINREEIRRALADYCRGVDRRDWDLVESAYHKDAYDDHGSYKGGRDGLMEWLRSRHANIEQSLHVLGQSIIDFVGKNKAVAETYCIVYQRYGQAARDTIRLWIGDEELAPGECIKAVMPCRYVDRFEKRGGVWRIVHRTVVFEEVTGLKEANRLSETWALAQRDTSDAIWNAYKEYRD